MVVFKGMKCTIDTASGPLKEYSDPETDAGGDGTTVYIQSTDGQSFSVKFRLQDNRELASIANSVALHVYIDGKEAGCRYLAYPFASREVDGIDTCDSNGSWVRHTFAFSNIDVTEDGPKPQDGKNISSLGEIMVLVRRYHISGAPHKASNPQRHNLKGVEKLHEKELKGRDISHSVRFSEPRAIQAPTQTRGVYVDSYKRPFATFKFRYRSERALKGRGLIPRTPSPSATPEPANSNRSISASLQGMSREDLEAEVLRLRGAKSPEAKREGRKVLKRSQSADAGAGPSNRIIKKRKKPVVIDLTSD